MDRLTGFSLSDADFFKLLDAIDAAVAVRQLGHGGPLSDYTDPEDAFAVEGMEGAA